MLTHLFAIVGSQAATPLAQGAAPDVPWMRIVLVLVLCLGLATATIGFVRLRHGMPFLPDRLTNPIAQRNASRISTRQLEIVERLPAGPTSQFVLLARGKQRYLLHLSQNGATEIDRFSEEPDEADPC